jgi:murein DD-endopeptidase MepM/ murein hydrolase activator NlpD
VKKIIYLIFAVLVLFSLFFALARNLESVPATQAEKEQISDAVGVTKSPFTPPMSKAKERITKKPLGIYISSKYSPVSPERFAGFHTGTDFEAFSDEQNIDVPVYAICTGRVLQKQFGRGYGGMIVQSCELSDSPITVVYGHIRLTSAKAGVRDTLSAGEFLANLGTGYSTETDGERKHLHLGIHKGAASDTRGYVSNKSELLNWIDIVDYL